MLPRLPIALVQVTAGNTPESLLNGIRKIIHFQYPAKEITKRAYKNIINATNLLQNRYYVYKFCKW